MIFKKGKNAVLFLSVLLLISIIIISYLYFQNHKLQSQINNSLSNKQSAQQTNKAVIFFKLKAQPDQINSFISEIKSIKDVQGVKYISQQEAYQIYKEQNKDDPLLLSMVNPENLPSSLEVTINNPDKKNQIIQIAKNNPIVEEAL